jgi:hypothetical protein
MRKVHIEVNETWSVKSVTWQAHGTIIRDPVAIVVGSRGPLCRSTYNPRLRERQPRSAGEVSGVSFRWKDYVQGGKQKIISVSADEFLRRFLGWSASATSDSSRIADVAICCHAAAICSARTAQTNLTHQLIGDVRFAPVPCSLLSG